MSETHLELVVTTLGCLPIILNSRLLIWKNRELGHDNSISSEESKKNQETVIIKSYNFVESDKLKRKTHANSKQNRGKQDKGE